MVRTVSLRVVLAASLVLLTNRGAAFAQHGHGGPHHSTVFVGGYFYDPFFGPYPWWPAYAYPYPYYPAYDISADLRLLVTPREANVYVDGFYSGIVDDFDGFFQHLPVPPGGHEVVLYLQGYRTVHQTVYASPGSTYKLTYTMERLAAGETSEPPPVAPPVPEPPAGSATTPRTPPPDGQQAVRTSPPGTPAPRLEPPEAPPVRAEAAGFGSLVIRVQPGNADILIDGEHWQSSDPTERLVVQVAEGSHHVVIQKSGFKAFSSDVVVRRGETAPLNVSLSPE
jgi:PEGA domain-containing protein